MATAKVVPHQSSKAVSVVGDQYLPLVSGQETGDRYAIFEVHCVPNGGPPPHIHTREDESFYVIEGAVEFLAGDKMIKAPAGTFVNVPKGTLHTFKTSSQGARMLVQVCPAGLERFFEEVGEAPGTPVTDAHIQKVMATAPKYGIEIKV